MNNKYKKKYLKYKKKYLQLTGKLKGGMNLFFASDTIHGPNTMSLPKLLYWTIDQETKLKKGDKVFLNELFNRTNEEGGQPWIKDEWIEGSTTMQKWWSVVKADGQPWGVGEKDLAKIGLKKMINAYFKLRHTVDILKDARSGGIEAQAKQLLKNHNMFWVERQNPLGFWRHLGTSGSPSAAMLLQIFEKKTLELAEAHFDVKKWIKGTKSLADQEKFPTTYGWWECGRGLGSYMIHRDRLNGELKIISTLAAYQDPLEKDSKDSNRMTYHFPTNRFYYVLNEDEMNILGFDECSMAVWGEYCKDKLSSQQLEGWDCVGFEFVFTYPATKRKVVIRRHARNQDGSFMNPRDVPMDMSLFPPPPFPGLPSADTDPQSGNPGEILIYSSTSAPETLGNIDEIRLGNARIAQFLKAELGNEDKKLIFILIKLIGDWGQVIYYYILKKIYKVDVLMATCDMVVYCLCITLNLDCVYNAINNNFNTTIRATNSRDLVLYKSVNNSPKQQAYLTFAHEMLQIYNQNRKISETIRNLQNLPKEYLQYQGSPLQNIEMVQALFGAWADDIDTKNNRFANLINVWYNIDLGKGQWVPINSTDIQPSNSTVFPDGRTATLDDFMKLKDLNTPFFTNPHPEWVKVANPHPNPERRRLRPFFYEKNGKFRVDEPALPWLQANFRKGIYPSTFTLVEATQMIAKEFTIIPPVTVKKLADGGGSLNISRKKGLGQHTPAFMAEKKLEEETENQRALFAKFFPGKNWNYKLSHADNFAKTQNSISRGGVLYKRNTPSKSRVEKGLRGLLKESKMKDESKMTKKLAFDVLARTKTLDDFYTKYIDELYKYSPDINYEQFSENPIMKKNLENITDIMKEFIVSIHVELFKRRLVEAELELIKAELAENLIYYMGTNCITNFDVMQDDTIQKLHAHFELFHFLIMPYCDHNCDHIALDKQQLWLLWLGHCNRYNYNLTDNELEAWKAEEYMEHDQVSLPSVLPAPEVTYEWDIREEIYQIVYTLNNLQTLVKNEWEKGSSDGREIAAISDWREIAAIQRRTHFSKKWGYSGDTILPSASHVGEGWEWALFLWGDAPLDVGWSDCLDPNIKYLNELNNVLLFLIKPFMELYKDFYTENFPTTWVFLISNPDSYKTLVGMWGGSAVTVMNKLNKPEGAEDSPFKRVEMGPDVEPAPSVHVNNNIIESLILLQIYTYILITLDKTKRHVSSAAPGYNPPPQDEPVVYNSVKEAVLALERLSSM